MADAERMKRAIARDIEDQKAALEDLEAAEERSAARKARFRAFGATTVNMGGAWITSGLTALALGLGTSMLGRPDIGGFPLDLALGVGLGITGAVIKRPQLQTASIFIVGAATGRLASTWFHGPAVGNASPAQLAAHHPRGALHAAYGYGFGAEDPLVAAARHL